MMAKEYMRPENPAKVEQEQSLRNTKEERLTIDMVLELSRRFGLSQPHDVAAVLKVSAAEAKRLLALAAAKPGSR